MISKTLIGIGSGLLVFLVLFILIAWAVGASSNSRSHP